MTLPVLILFIIFFVYILSKQSKKNRSECMTPKPTMPRVPTPYSLTESASRPASKVSTGTKNTQAGDFETHDQPGFDDYHEYMVSTGLESSVVDSHKIFTKDIQTTTTGASNQTVFSHDDDIVPKWGLRRKSTIVPISVHAREVPSQTNEQILDNASHHNALSGLF